MKILKQESHTSSFGSVVVDAIIRFNTKEEYLKWLIDTEFEE